MTINRFDFVYSSVSTAFTPPATPTDVFTINGNATTNVYIMKMGISTTQGTAGINAWHLVKRSTADTGGTATQPAAVPYDSKNPVAAATINQYSANPGALGTAIGDVWAGWIDSPLVTTAGIGGFVTEINFLDTVGQPLSLLSAAETLAWNFAGAALPAGLSVYAYVVWYEKSKT